MEEVLIHFKESVIIFHNVNRDHAHIMGGLSVIQVDSLLHIICIELFL